MVTCLCQNFMFLLRYFLCLNGLQNLLLSDNFSHFYISVYFFAVDGEVISSIGKGLCVLVGISKYDTSKEIEYM